MLRLRTAVFGLVFLSTVAISHAQMDVWVGGANNTNFDNAANWSGDAVPTNNGNGTDTLNFTSATANVNLDVAANFQALAVVPAAGATVNISGSGSLTLGEGGIQLTPGGDAVINLTIGAPLTLSTTQIWSGGNITLNSTLSGSSALTLGSGDSSTYTFNSGASSLFSGAVTVSGNATIFLGATGTPVGSGMLTLGDGSTLGVPLGGSIAIANPLTIGDGTTGYSVSIGQLSFNNPSVATVKFSGNVTLVPYGNDQEIDITPNTVATFAGTLGASNPGDCLDFGSYMGGGNSLAILQGSISNVSRLDLEDNASVIFDGTGISQLQYLEDIGEEGDNPNIYVGFGRGYVGSLAAALGYIYNPGGFTGSVGLDTTSGSVVTFTDAVDLSSFTDSGFVGLGSATKAIVQGLITPPGGLFAILGTNYPFGGGGGTLTVTSAITNSQYALNPHNGLILSPGNAPLTLILQGSTTYNGPTYVVGGALIFNTNVPSTAIHVGQISEVGYVGATLSTQYTHSDPDSFIDLLTTGSSGVVGFDNLNGAWVFGGTDTIDLSNYPGLFLGTATSVTYSGPITPNSSSGFQFSGVKGGSVTVTSPSLTGANTVTIGLPTPIESFGSVSSVTLPNANSYSGVTKLNSGYLYVGNNGSIGSNTLDIAGPSDDGTGTIIGLAPFGANVSLNNTITVPFEGVYLNTTGSLYTLDLSGAISGNGSIIVDGPVKLDGNNSYEQGTTVQGGTLIADNNVGSATGTGNISISSGATLQFGNGDGNGSVAANAIIDNGTVAFDWSDTNTFSNVINGSGNVSVLGGTAIFSGGNSYTGVTSVTGGTLVADNSSGSATGTGNISVSSGATFQIGNSDANGSVAATTISDGGTVAFDRTDSPTISNNITGLGGVENLGTGTVTLSGANTYTGSTSINSGTLVPGNTSALGNGGALIITTGGILNMNGINVAVGAVSGDTSARIQTGGATLTSSSANTATFAGIISGASGALTLGGTETEILTGANTYSGPTTINGGTLSVASLGNGGAASGIGASSNAAANLTLNGGTLEYTGAATTSDHLFTLGSGGGIINASGSGFLNLNNTGNIAFSSPNVAENLTLTGTGNSNALWSVLGDNGTGMSSLTKTGTGFWFLDAPNTYTGPTTINGGTLDFGDPSFGNGIIANGGLPSGIGASTNAAANLVINGGILMLEGPAASTDRLFTIGPNGGTITDDTFGETTGPITFSNPGSIALTGTNTSRTLTLSNSSAYPITLDPTLGDNGTGASSVVKTGTGTWALDGANTYTGGTTITSGTLLADNASGSATGTGPISVGTGATLDIGNADTAGAVAAATITDNGTVEFARTDNISILSNISGAGGVLVQESGGTVTLSGTNTYSGPTTINGGTLSVSSINNGGAASGIGASSNGAANLTLNGGTLEYTGAATTSDHLFTLGSGGGIINASGSGALNLNNAGNIAFSSPNVAENLTLTGSGFYNVIKAVLGDNGTRITSLTKTGSGLWYINSADTYTGPTTIDGGTLNTGSTAFGTGIVANGGVASGLGASSSAAANLVLDGGTLTLEGPAASTDRLFTLGPNGGTISGISVYTLGSITFSNPGSIALSGANTARTLTLDNSSAYPFTLDPTLGDDGTGASSVVTTGTGTWVLDGANTYTGGTTVTAGVLLLGNDSAAGIGGTITLDSGAILAASGGPGITRTLANNIFLNGSSAQFGNNDDNNMILNGLLSGGGAVTYAGGSTGHLTINGANTGLSASTFTVASGTAIAGNSSAFGSTGSINLTGGAGITVETNVTISNPLSFSGGSANVLSGNGTVASAFTANSSTVLAPSGSTSVNSPGDLTFTNTLTLASGSAIHFEIDNATGVAGTDFGLISAGGGLNLTAAPNTITFNIVSTDASGNAASIANFNPSTPYSWMFATSSSISGFNSSSTQFDLITSGFENSTNGGTFSVSEGGNDLFLNFTPVPEPSTWCMMGAGLLAVAPFALRRRRLAKA